MKMKFDITNKKALFRIMAFLVCVVCFPSFAAGGQADMWRLYYTATDGTTYFYDFQSIERTAKALTQADKRRIVKSRQRIKKAWQVKVREKIFFNGPDYEFKESKILQEFDCSAKKVHTLMRSNVHKNGSIQIKGKTGIWQKIDSEPNLKNLYTIVCPS